MKLFPYNRSQTIRIIFIIAVIAIVICVILDSLFATSALLYLAVPFIVSVLIHQFIPYETDDTRSRQLFNHLRDATVVMFATSFILFEGFICVLMFMPIYYLCALIHYAFTRNRETTTMSDTNLHARIDFAGGADPVSGVVRWSMQKSVWWSGMLIGGSWLA